MVAAQLVELVAAVDLRTRPSRKTPLVVCLHMMLKRQPLLRHRSWKTEGQAAPQEEV